ncbi:uncharacterized mitochondrial protein AtMg00310-like [Rutidosis leptorrhynchoides]|uniref:uncharacterized mitochondrial protein AtMg00310-like n=1 Tax=Rutidosis leptorrhynchoides TaxID=125765 RepID=UPI003A9A332F
MQVYWCSAFILPEAIIKDTEKVLRGFLWCQENMKHGKAKVKWDDVCLPKDEGSLGIRRLKYWNIALMTNHVWSIITYHKSLWVSWVRDYNLPNRNFWDVAIRSSSCWSWRKILLMRPIIRKFLFYLIGNALAANAYQDKWCDTCPLSEFVTPRDMAVVSLHLNASFNDIFALFNGQWPNEWILKL